MKFIHNFFQKFKDISVKNSPIRVLNTYFEKHPYKSHIYLSLILSLFAVIIIQSLECMSFVEGFTFIFRNTYFFIINFLIVFSTLSVVFFFRKRLVFMSLLFTLWVILGVCNFLVILHRPMPISAIDFVVMTTTMDIIPHYFSLFNTILCVVLSVALISIFVFLFIKSKRYQRTLHQAITPFVCSVVLLVVFLFGGSISGNLKISYNDVTAAYDEHGFIYCFSSSMFTRGIPKPSDYSNIDIQNVTEKYPLKPLQKIITPNIIVLQLESFFDTSKYDKYTLKKDPIPNFHKICSEFGEGSLIVPSNGGGTVNTEFEILTGMNLEHFETIEYPYTTVLKNTTCESAPFILENYGYTSHAIHNHTGVFYARNQVYPNLGFDSFIPLEFMQYEKAETGWAKDSAIFRNIIDSLESTKGNDFIFAVTVQGHGAYVDSDNPKNPFKIKNRDTLSGNALSKAYMFEHYCSLINETDALIGQLYEYVMTSDEEFVVILYGDHLPSLDFNSELYDYNSDYMTTYTVFSNIPEKFSYEFSDNLPTYRLMSTVFAELGMREGLINRINMNYTDKNYQSDLEQIQYDMLYGEGYSYNNKPYTRKNTKFGCNDISISSVTYHDGFLMIKGKNFTIESEININNWERDTVFVDSNTLVCACSGIDENDIISVCQTAVDGTKLLETYYNN